jgi:hypothetical protein
MPIFAGKGKTSEKNFHLSMHDGKDLSLIKILGGLKIQGGTKISIALSPSE